MIERNQWLILLLVGLFYMLFLIIFTKAYDWIYSIFKLDSTGSWIILFSLIPVTLLIHFLMYGISELKYRCCCPRRSGDDTSSSKQSQDAIEEPLLGIN